MEGLQHALSVCPFLARLRAEKGEAYATHVACKPSQPFGRGCPFSEGGLKSTFELFHGSSGVAPLISSRPSAEASTEVDVAGPGKESSAVSNAQMRQNGAGQQPAFAAISLAGAAGFFPSFDSIFGKRARQRQQQRRSKGAQKGAAGQQGKPAGAGGDKGTAAQQGTSASQQHKGSSGRIPRQSTPQSRASPYSSSRPPGRAGGLGGAGRAGPGPLRGASGMQLLGGLVSLSKKGELQCPAAVVRARAFVAQLKPVRQLRPRALPVKLLAIGAASMAANIPMGAWREHQRKFSPGWFLAVHATIPFIALLRKGVVMPKWAIGLTIASAVVGQAVGARLERARLLQEQPSITAAADRNLQPAHMIAAVRPTTVCSPTGIQRCFHEAAAGWSSLSQGIPA